MGGQSSSQLCYHPKGYAVFEGVVSLANNGGFASIRSTTSALSVPNVRRYLLQVKGDGKNYKLNLRQDDTFDGINYQADFATIANQWIEIELPLTAFLPRFRGRDVPGAPMLESARVRQIGLMIAARQVGPFSLALRRITVTRAT